MPKKPAPRTDQKALQILNAELVECRSCPRLVEWREQVAREKVRRFREWNYWGRPVPSFGDPNGRMIIVGLAPAAHGANRTGRMFTGDRSGDFLFAALHRAGLAQIATSTSKDDGQRLSDAYMIAPCRCAPPGNMPLPTELANCARWFDRELPMLKNVKVALALGAIGWNATLDAFARQGAELGKPRPKFAHGAIAEIKGWPTLFGSYHVSQQNTNTGRLTEQMFDEVLGNALRSLGRK
jgi:uracil-DNA glycosylase family 4